MSYGVLVHPGNQASLLVVLCLGFATNTVSAVVWTQQLGNRAGAFFLSCLSISDCLFCLMEAVMKGMTLTDVLRSSCSHGVVEVLATFFANTSRLLTVAVVAQRWVAVARPLSVSRWCSPRRRLVVLALLAPLPLGYAGFESYGHWLYRTLCQERFNSSLPEYGQYVRMWESAMLSHLIFHAPLIAGILFFNAMLLYSVCTIKKVQTGNVGGSMTREWHSRLQRSMTLIVACVSMLTLLDLLLLFIRNLQASGYVDLGLDLAQLYDLDVVQHWVYSLNGSTNFFLYSCFGQEFRVVLRAGCRRVFGAGDGSGSDSGAGLCIPATRDAEMGTVVSNVGSLVATTSTKLVSDI